MIQSKYLNACVRINSHFKALWYLQLHQGGNAQGTKQDSHHYSHLIITSTTRRTLYCMYEYTCECSDSDYNYILDYIYNHYASAAPLDLHMYYVQVYLHIHVVLVLTCSAHDNLDTVTRLRVDYTVLNVSKINLIKYVLGNRYRYRYEVGGRWQLDSNFEFCKCRKYS